VLVVRVGEPATDGRANRAVTAALAAELGVTKAAVRIARGAASRHKVVEVAGDDGVLAATWQRLLDR
jgi:uncharacterized protein YggU (UPF0235/DUF167 family)